MVLALLLALNLADAVPARWPNADPKTLDLLADTPINTLLLDQAPRNAAFAEAAASRGISVLEVVRPGADVAEAARRAAGVRLAGVVLEGEVPPAAVDAVRGAGLAVIELPPRSAIRFDAASPVTGTTQGVWPGVRVQAKAAATGGPWIETNTGFLRFLRANTTATVWIGNVPSANTVVPATGYLAAIGDAAVVGARWIVALDEDLSRRLFAREPAAVRDWGRIALHLRFLEEHKEWRNWGPLGQLAVVQEADSGAMLSGGILDMLVTRHLPVRPVPAKKLTAEALAGAKWAVNVDPESLSTPQKEILRNFTRAGGTLLNGPPGWKFPAPQQGQITLSDKELAQIDDIWKGMNSMIGRSNLGVRLFNVAGMLSCLLGSPDGKQVVLQLVNYTNYPVESITAHALGKFTRARLLSPGQPARDLELYPVEGGAGCDIPQVSALAALVLE
jgi:hypothetical protein